MQAFSCHSFINRFAHLLTKVNVPAISDVPYCQNYLQHILTHKKYYLNIYATVLNEMLLKVNKPITTLSVLDFGTGNGLLALFAKYCGCSVVYACDSNEDFLQAAQKLSTQIKVPIHKFINGSLPQVALQLNTQPLNAVISTDVIEHIYNLPEFFAGLKNINPEMVSVFTTASNPYNKFKVAQLRKLQKRDELLGYAGNTLETEGHRSFLAIREEIIEKNFNSLPHSKITALAKATQGLMYPDILKASEQYVTTGVLPKITDAYNTCHPITGSFTERVLGIAEYKKIYEAQGFALSVLPGFYNAHGSLKNKTLNGLLNVLLKLMPFKLSPFIILVAIKK